MSIDTTAPHFRPDGPTPALPAAPGRDETLRALLAAEPALRAAGAEPVSGSEEGGAHLWQAPVAPGYPAADLWSAFRNHFPHTGFWPLLTRAATWSTAVAVSPYRRSPGAGRETPDGAAWLTERHARLLADARAEGERNPVPRSAPGLDEKDYGATEFDGFDWADAWSMAGDEFDRLTLVPVAAPWLVPGRLGWSGACNAGLGWSEHAAVLRRWQAAPGAELLALDGDTAWLRHPRPFPDADTALRTALEAYLYCHDAVDQDHGSLDELARHLSQPLWRLWWD